MRELLFRGKRVNNGEWVYGYYSEFHNRPIVDEPNSCQIFEPKENASKLFNSMIGGIWHIVDAETIGQFTGLTDKNGKKIFEGDIVRFNNQLGEIVYECGCFGIGITKGIKYKRFEDYVEEKTNNYYSGVRNDNFISLFEIYWNCNNVNNKIDELEVIGNIHDQDIGE